MFVLITKFFFIFKCETLANFMLQEVVLFLTVYQELNLLIAAHRSNFIYKSKYF